MSWAVGGYDAIRELGRGASGRVVLARHDQTGTPVAIKYLSDDLRARGGFISRFRAEARILSTLDAPDITRLYEYVEEPGGAAIVMELVDGVSLRNIIVKQGPIEPEAALCILKGSLAGLAAAHVEGVVHRDYKPENVLVDTSGGSKLVDFGIAMRSGREAEVAGTPAYMAPELWRDGSASAAGDIYAATATFVECLTGMPPYSGPVDAMRLQHENAPIPLDPVPADVRDLVRRGLAKDPQQRPADATAFLRELQVAASAGYGDDWEIKGRRRLAERVALLALLLPLGGAALTGLAMASTALGPWQWAAATIAALVVGASCGLGASAGGASGPTLSDGPTTPVTAPAIGTESPSPTASASPTSSGPTSTPTNQPPPVTFKVLKLSIVSFVDDGAGKAILTVSVVTSGTGAFTLTLRYAGSDDAGVPGLTNPETYPIPLSGSTSYEIPHAVASCGDSNYLGVSVSTVPAAQGGAPTYADFAVAGKC